MDINLVARTTWRILRTQKMVWIWAGVLLGMSLILGLLGVAIDASTTWFAFETPDAAPVVVIALLCPFFLLILASVVVSLVSSAGIIYTVHLAYDRSEEQPVTWEEVKPVLLPKTLRLFLMSLLWGVAALVLVFLVGLLFAAPGVGLVALLDAAQSGNLDAIFEALGVGGFFLLCCGGMCTLFLGIFLIAPLFTTTEVAVVVEDAPFMTALERALQVVRRKYGWILITYLIILLLVWLLGLVVMPFNLVSGFLAGLAMEGTVPAALHLIAQGMSTIVNSLHSVLQTLLILTVFTVVYRHLQERIAQESAEGPLFEPPQEDKTPPSSKEEQVLGDETQHFDDLDDETPVS